MKELKFDFFKITRSTTLLIVLAVIVPLLFVMPVYSAIIKTGDIISSVTGGGFGFGYLSIAMFMALFVTKDFSSKYFVNVHKNTNAFFCVLSKFAFGALLVFVVLLVEFGAYCLCGALAEQPFVDYILISYYDDEVSQLVPHFNAAQWFTDYGLKALSVLAWMSVVTLLSLLCKRDWIALIFGVGYAFACSYVYLMLDGLIGSALHIERCMDFSHKYALMIYGTTNNMYKNTVHMFVLLGYIVVAFLLSWLCVWLRQNKGKKKMLQPQA